MSVPAAGTDQRIAIYGALDYGSGQVLARCAPQKSSAGFADFLAEIAATWPTDHLVLVMDNASYHRSPAMREWWAAQDGRVTPFWLPVYSPKLNLIERVWRFLKQKLACHRFWADPEGLEQAATTLLGKTVARFHTSPGPSITLGQN